MRSFLGILRKIDVFWIFFSASILALVLAYVAQYFFGLKPCVLCLYQRVPFFVVMGLSLVGGFCGKEMLHKGRRRPIQAGIVRVGGSFQVVRRWLFWSCLGVILVNLGIAGFHLGVENGVFRMTEKCTQGIGEFGSVEELAGFLKAQGLARCDKPEFFVLGLSMAGWNVLFCLGLLGVGAVSKK